MYYIKFKCPEGRSHLQLITPDNVVCICSECGREVPIDLGKVTEYRPLDLLEDEFYCEECQSKVYRRAKAHDIESILQKICDKVAKDLIDDLKNYDQPVHESHAKEEFEDLVFQCFDIMEYIEMGPDLGPDFE